MNAITTSRLGLPLLAPGQAGKEITHNEALALIDLAVAPTVIGVRKAPPPAPRVGEAWLVDADGEGDWRGADGAVAGWSAAGWRFVQMPVGSMLAVGAEGDPLERTRTGWRPAVIRGAEVRVGGDRIVGARGAAVADPTGGATVDAEARTALIALLEKLRAHGLIDR